MKYSIKFISVLASLTVFACDSMFCSEEIGEEFMLSYESYASLSGTSLGMTLEDDGDVNITIDYIYFFKEKLGRLKMKLHGSIGSDEVDELRQLCNDADLMCQPEFVDGKPGWTDPAGSDFTIATIGGSNSFNVLWGPQVPVELQNLSLELYSLREAIIDSADYGTMIKQVTFRIHPWPFESLDSIWAIYYRYPLSAFEDGERVLAYADSLYHIQSPDYYTRHYIKSGENFISLYVHGEELREYDRFIAIQWPSSLPFTLGEVPPEGYYIEGANYSVVKSLFDETYFDLLHVFSDESEDLIYSFVLFKGSAVWVSPE